MPAHVASREALACKLVTSFRGNADKNLSTHNAIILLFEESTGMLKAVSTFS